jgi:hypothetical protein
MINLDDFTRWFNKDFWRAFGGNRTLPINMPQTKNDKRKLLKSIYESILSARYAPSIPEIEIVINKGNGVARTTPIFCIEDYCVYYFCIKELEEVICQNRTPNTFGGWSLGGKLRKDESVEIECELTGYGRYSFNPLAWTKYFGEFNSLLYAQLDRGNYSHVLQLDLSNFYDCVRLDILERWIREELKGNKGWIVSLLFYLLNQWNRRNTGLHPLVVGLPQDALADCSRILANFYLQKYDNFAEKICKNAGALYFRYSDDQMILLNDLDKVEGLLLLLTRNLDRYGLRVNQKKVFLWKADDLQEHRCRSIQELFSKDGDNKNPALVRKFVEAYLDIPKEKLKTMWNGGSPLLNRLVWANLESLPVKIFKLIVTRLISENYLLTAGHKKIIRIFELNNKLSKPIDFTKRLQKLGKKSVHNSYHYEALAFAGLIKDNTLKKFFKERLKSLEEQMNSLEIS